MCCQVCLDHLCNYHTCRDSFGLDHSYVSSDRLSLVIFLVKEIAPLTIRTLFPWCVHKCVLGTAVMIICLGHLYHQGLTFIVKQIEESLHPPCGLCTQMCFTPSATLLKAFFALFLHLFMISNANLSNDFPCDVYTSVFNTQRNPAQSSFSPTWGLRQYVLCVFVYQHYHY